MYTVFLSFFLQNFRFHHLHWISGLCPKGALFQNHRTLSALIWAKIKVPRLLDRTGKQEFWGTERRERTENSRKLYDMHLERPMRKQGQESKAVSQKERRQLNLILIEFSSLMKDTISFPHSDGKVGSKFQNVLLINNSSYVFQCNDNWISCLWNN